MKKELVTFSPKYRPSLSQAALTFGTIVTTIGAGLFILKVSLHSLLLVSILIASVSAWTLTKGPFRQIRNAMNAGISGAFGAIYIFILIGVLIAAFIQAGTVSTLIYYGLKWISPGLFLPASLILCAFMSTATGTSWGTVGTAGVVLMGIGEAMGIPLPVMAGVVVSGACFGDKMSPVSDTTVLAAMSSETDLYSHIRSMCYTSIPTFLIVLVITCLISLQYADHVLPVEKLSTLLTALNHHYAIHLICLLPMLVMVLLSFRKVSAEPAMMASVGIAIALAIFVQGKNPVVVLNALYAGGTSTTGVASLDSLLSRGGIAEMMWTMSLALMALALGGILNAFGFLSVFIAAVVGKMTSAFSLVTTTIIACVCGNMLMGEAYMSIVLGGQLFRKAYDKAGIARRVLSRSLEEGATLSAGLIPWTTGGAFFATTLHVSAWEYAPWAMLNWINPLMGIIFAFFGISIFREQQEMPAESLSVDL